MGQNEHCKTGRQQEDNRRKEPVAIKLVAETQRTVSRIAGARSPWKQAAQSGAVSEGNPNRCVHGASVKSTDCDIPVTGLAEFLLSAGKHVWKDC